ncbi:MAG: hypothetical protein U0263_18425 [Polyangiaceae bacterium]
MKDFFVAGGFAMYPILGLGFLLVAASVLQALRPGARYSRLVLALGTGTLMLGVLGSTLGVCLSCRYIHQVPGERQLGILAMGIDESLHNLVLASIFVVLSSLIFAVGALREGKAATSQS